MIHATELSLLQISALLIKPISFFLLRYKQKPFQCLLIICIRALVAVLFCCIIIKFVTGIIMSLISQYLFYLHVSLSQPNCISIGNNLLVLSSFSGLYPIALRNRLCNSTEGDATCSKLQNTPVGLMMS